LAYNGTTLTLRSDTTLPTLSVLSNSATPSLRIGAQGNLAVYWQIGRDNVTTGDFIFSTEAAERMRITNAGNVGIGVTTASERLHISNATASTNAIAQFTNGTTGTAAGNGLYVGIDTSNEASVFNFYNSALKFGTNGGEKVRITSSAAGELLVGSTSALQSSANRGVIQVNGTSQSIFTMAVGGAVKGYLYNDGTNQTVTAATGALIFEVPTERMRITSDGDVGIGTTTPASTLEVSKSANGEYGIIIRNATSGTTAGSLLKFIAGTDVGQIIRFPAGHSAKANELFITNVGTTSPITFATQDTERMRIDSGGNVMVGTTTAGNQKFTVSSAVEAAGVKMRIRSQDTPISISPSS
jgi:hypothetical protein